jgi:hypothetical protein
VKGFQAITPAPDTAFVALGRTAQGKLFKKHILTEGVLIHPQTKERIPIDGKFLDTMVTNFNNGICDIVQIPLANKLNEHDESPDRNIGEVIGLEHDGDKLYAITDIRREDAQGEVGKTLLGASAFMHTDYTDTHTDEKVGPTLLHMAVTNRPYVHGLEDFKELIAASADNDGETVLLTAAAPVEEPIKVPKTLDELKAELKTDHNIDLDALQLSAVTPAPTPVTPVAPKLDKDTILALTAAGVLKPVEGDKPEEVTGEDVTDAIVELAGNYLKLSADHASVKETVAQISQERAEMEVDGLIRQGRVVPAQKDTFVELSMSNRDLFAKLVPDTPIVALSVEKGTTAPEEPEAPEDVNAEILRLTGEGSYASENGYIRAVPTGPKRRRRSGATA